MDALFVVRVWSERGKDGACGFTVEHVGTRVRRQLGCARELIEFLENALWEAPQAVEEPISGGVVARSSEAATPFTHHRRGEPMARTFLAVLSCSLLLVAAPALAELKVGQSAPTFDAKASLGGNVFTFDLADALKKGPVVLYFYPAAFTKGCTKEAHDFADNIDKYKKLGATVIGVSEDDVATLQKFSVSECRNKFAVAADADAKIAKAYDAVLETTPKAYANRTSYVIGQDGKIAFAYTSLDPDLHVAKTLAAVQQLQKK